MTETLAQESYFCRQCQTRKAPDAFEWIVSKSRSRSYYPAPRKICRLCCGDEGHKPCRACGIDKQISEFYWIKSGNSDARRPMPDCKVCWRDANKLRTRGQKNPPSSKSGPKRGTVYKDRKPPGWTPPPTAEQLAAIHARVPIPEWWRGKIGEDCA